MAARIDLRRLFAAVLVSLVVHLWVVEFFFGYVAIENSGGRMPSLVATLVPSQSAAFSRSDNSREQPVLDERRALEPDPIKENSSGVDARHNNKRSKFDSSNAHPLHLLTKTPKPLDEIDLNSSDITDTAVSAVITLRLWLNDSGRVENVIVLSDGASALSKAWIDKVIQRFMNARFTPGEIDGLPVATVFEVTVTVEAL